jgi:hypothetical protein
VVAPLQDNLRGQESGMRLVSTSEAIVVMAADMVVTVEAGIDS